jgi:hypothetical protein
MRLQEAREKTRRALQDLSRFGRLERVLAATCALTPVLLLWADDGTGIRDSISDYYSMGENQLFYVPLTMAAMLFVVNGVVKDRQLYNTYLGAMLGGLLLFNNVDFTRIHFIFTAAFFVGNVAVILLFSSIKDRRFKIGLVVAIVLAMLGWKFLSWFTLFWAEWFSLAVIAFHYIIESVVDGKPEPARRVQARAA